MRLSAILAAATATSAVALSIPRRDAADELFVIELEPGVTKQVTEAEKWNLKAQGKHFIDVTNYPDDLAASQLQIQAVTFPSKVSQQASVTPLLSELSSDNMKANLEPFTQFTNRYYKSASGAESSRWLLSKVQSVISASGSNITSAKAFTHSWGQSSIIATIPGRSNKTIVIGAHQDSVNQNNPSTGRAPGADDDGSGTVTILEAMRVLLTNPAVAAGEVPNTIEFHWYAAEEGGLLGSAAIFQSYKTAGRDVKAMLQQDMTGYSKGTIDAGLKESVGVITDFVDAGLTEFIKKVITAYCAIPYVETKCGYACSDHASASKNGYPSSFVIEADMDHTHPQIHTTQDTLDKISYSHMLEHAKMTVGFGYELAFAADL
ncbi:hypothetical protein BDV95DRAFT_638644 [Massariosphaeria phaeospora]|uniref:Peptide hydrolase n=1 Tax=Massariosphaeria phaeospora TaxID=100035 RepID=A0A7C8ICR2_9PLEO|nr:hypothetical protein BDV95DRAFT_638644 [Massariosphaeria phaeospora]